ncbi:MAG: alpha/beta fold hydrolase [Candidatus Helarchaeota archaeon]
MPYFIFKNRKIFYIDYGKHSKNPDKTLLFIHGAGENLNLWRYQIQYFFKEYRIIAIDLPGHGRSQVIEKLSLSLYLEIVNKLIIHLNLNWTVLVGHSMGGAIAQLYAITYKCLQGLILISTAPTFKHIILRIEDINHNFLKALKFFKTTDKIVINLEELSELALTEIIKTPIDVTLKDFLLINQFDVRNKLNKIVIPTLIICGKDDILTPIENSKYLHKYIKNSKFYVIPNSGHLVYIEKYILINKIIRNFIQNL